MRTLTALLVATLVLLAGCEGEKGPVGPSGNANVVTGTISPTNEEWLWNSYFWYRTQIGAATGYFTRYVNIPVEELTPGFIATGIVLVSFEAELGSGRFTPLPFHFPSNTREYLHTKTFEVLEGMIRLHYFNIPLSPTAALPDLATWQIPTYTFTYTLIEGNALPAMTAEGIDVTDHAQVLEYLSSH